jgi:hypothetical protein
MIGPNDGGRSGGRLEWWMMRGQPTISTRQSHTSRANKPALTIRLARSTRTVKSVRLNRLTGEMSAILGVFPARRRS